MTKYIQDPQNLSLCENGGFSETRIPGKSGDWLVKNRTPSNQTHHRIIFFTTTQIFKIQ